MNVRYRVKFSHAERTELRSLLSGGKQVFLFMEWGPRYGVIFIQSGPRRVGSTLASRILGGLDWNAGCGDDCQDTPGVLFPWQADQGDLPRAALIAQGCAEGHSLERHRVPLRTFPATASPDWSLATAA